MFRDVKSWILVLAGVVAGHQLTHALTHHHANDAAHGYLAAVGVVLAPPAVWALLSLAWHEATTGRRLIRVRHLLVAQVAVFAAQETTERAVAGLGPIGTVSDSVLWLGIGVQFVVVGTTLTFVAAARRLLGRLSLPGKAIDRPHRVATLRSGASPNPAGPRFSAWVSRGPPVLV